MDPFEFKRGAEGMSGEPLPPIDEMPAPLREIVLGCAGYLFQEMLTKTDILDYDILSATMSREDHKDWHVILSAHAMPASLFEFNSKKDENRVTISTYIKAHTFFAQL
jgi:hypothetical protein